MKSLGESQAHLVSAAGFTFVRLLIGARDTGGLVVAQPSGKSWSCEGRASGWRVSSALPLYL